jgi:hypothetical protein
MKRACPSCGEVCGPGKYLCLSCWHELPEPTRTALKIRDGNAIRRLQKLYEDLAADTPIKEIEITA